MAVKASEMYLVFQNKAHHYQNLQEMRPKVLDHLSDSISHTMNAVAKQKYDRDFPKNKRYLVQTENKGFANRIESISHTDRRQIVADGSYARYNRFERNFRTVNHYKSEEDRQIQIQNKKIKQKIERMKSGSTKYWHSEYKNMSKFVKSKGKEELNSSRTSLVIEKKPFLPQPYLELLSHLQKSQSRSLNVSSTQLKHLDKQVIKLEQQSLFLLPQFYNKQQRLKRSKISMATLQKGEAEPKIQSQSKHQEQRKSIKKIQ